jgi:hypothetical protein
MKLLPISAPASDERDRAETDRVLSDCRQTGPRAPAAKAASWHQLRARVLKERGQPPGRLFVRWPAFVAYCSTMSLLVTLAFGWVRDRRPDVAVTPPPTSLPEEAAIAPTVAPPQPAPGPMREGWRRVDLGSVGQLELSASATLRLPPSAPTNEDTYSVGLESGDLCAAIAHRDSAKQGPFVVEAKNLRVVVVGTKFCVSSGDTPDLSWVSVEEGLVKVEREGRVAMVSAGELLQGGDPALRPLASEPSARAPAATSSARVRPTSCPAGDPLPARRRCLWQIAGGDDLAAQNALYMLGLLARDEEHDGAAALTIWQTYRHRFSRGAMMAEIDLAMLKELTAQNRFEDALSITDQFLGDFPGNFRAGEVSLKRADMLRVKLERPADAADAYRRMLSVESTPALRAEALYGLGLSQEALGRSADARTTWQRYRQEFPAGRRSAEVAHHLSAAPPGP